MPIFSLPMSTPSKTTSRGVNAPFKSPLRPKADHHSGMCSPTLPSRKEPNLSEDALRDEISRLTEQLMQNRSEPLDIQQELSRWRNRMHAYNEAKDACLHLFGRLAHARGCLVRDLYEEFGLELTD